MLLNLDTITTDAYFKLMDLDRKLVGTYNYLGIAYYWHYDFRHYLRDATPDKRKKVHNTFLVYNLKVDEVSQMHWKLLEQIIK